MHKFLLFVAIVAFAQTGITPNYATMQCNQRAIGKVYLMTLGQVGYPTCLEIGSGFRLVMKNGFATIEAAAIEVQPKLAPSFYFDLVTSPAQNIVQIQPSVQFQRFMQKTDVKPAIDQTCDANSFTSTETEMFVCTSTKKWKKILLGEL